MITHKSEEYPPKAFERRRVTRLGIIFKQVIYWDSSLANVVGEEVTIRVKSSDADKGKVEAFYRG